MNTLPVAQHLIKSDDSILFHDQAYWQRVQDVETTLDPIRLQTPGKEVGGRQVNLAQTTIVLPFPQTMLYELMSLILNGGN